MRRLLLIVLLTLPLAGCGGGASAGSAAEVVPAGATAFVEVDTDLDSGQWKQAQELLDRFPGKPRLLQRVRSELGAEGLDYERDIAPALGDMVAAVWLDTAAKGDNVVVLTQPDDEGKLRELIRRLDAAQGEQHAIGKVGGWTAVADEQALIDRLGRDGEKLADAEAYETAVEELPDERLVTAFVTGAALRELPGADLDWAAAALEAREDGAAALLVARGGVARAGAAYESSRLGEGPDDALAFLSFSAGAARGQAAKLAPLERLLGLPVAALLRELRGEGALWVRPGAPVPEATLVVGVRDAKRTLAALRRLTGGRTVFDLGPAKIRSGVLDGRLIVTTAPTIADAVRRPQRSLRESADFEAAADAAGLPDRTAGFLYVNVGDALPLVGLAAPDLPRELLENLRPIRSLVAWSEPDGDRSRFTIFVEIE